MVVSAWNPDESWVQDALLRVNATRGIPTLDLNVWSLVDVMVHPLGVHIHQQVANSLWVHLSPTLTYTISPFGQHLPTPPLLQVF